MLPKAAMVAKECGFNQSEPVCDLCAARIARFLCLLATARDSELIKMQHSCHHVDTIRHGNSSRAIFMFLTIDVCRPRWPGSGLALVNHARVEIW